MLDPELDQTRLEAAGGEGRAVVRAERQLAGFDAVDGGGAFDDRDRLVGAATQLEAPADDLARVQQSMIAIRYVQPCSATQTLDMSSCHSCRGRSTLKKPGRLRRSSGRRRWISFRSRITRSTRLRLTAIPSLRRTKAQIIR